MYKMHKYYFKIIFSFFIFILIGNINPTFANERKIVLVTYKSLTQPDGRYLFLVYSEVFRRLGMTLDYRNFPAKRCELMSSSGEVDGDFSRIYNYGDSQPNLIRVSEPHWTSGFLAVGIDPDIKLEGWSSLNGTDYRVAYTRGIKGCEINLPKYIPPARLDIVPNISSGFSKVLRRWSDIYVGAELNIMNALNSKKFKESELSVVGVMEQFSAHLYLHKKNKILVPKIVKILKKMKEEKLLVKFRVQADLKSYFDECNFNYCEEE